MFWSRIYIIAVALVMGFALPLMAEPVSEYNHEFSHLSDSMLMAGGEGAATARSVPGIQASAQPVRKQEPISFSDREGEDVVYLNDFGNQQKECDNTRNVNAQLDARGFAEPVTVPKSDSGKDLNRNHAWISYLEREFPVAYASLFPGVSGVICEQNPMSFQIFALSASNRTVSVSDDFKYTRKKQPGTDSSAVESLYRRDLKIHEIGYKSGIGIISQGQRAACSGIVSLCSIAVVAKYIDSVIDVAPLLPAASGLPAAAGSQSVWNFTKSSLTEISGEINSDNFLCGIPSVNTAYMSEEWQMRVGSSLTENGYFISHVNQIGGIRNTHSTISHVKEGAFGAIIAIHVLEDCRNVPSAYMNSPLPV